MTAGVACLHIRGNSVRAGWTGGRDADPQTYASRVTGSTGSGRHSPAVNRKALGRGRRFLPMGLATVLIVAGCVGGGTGPAASPATSSTTLVDIGAGLEGPSGLTATIVASGLANVAALAVDSDGRLWAATAAYSDEGADGLYVTTSPGAKPREVVAGLHTPLGLLWIGDTLYVSSAVGVEALRGFDGTRFASRTTVFALAKGAGEPNGLALSPDGRIVLGISAPCDACKTTQAESAAVVSFRPDGSDLRVEASGIRAPVGLAYVPGTSDLLVTMNQRDDLGADAPGDWLAVVRSGDAWGFPDCYGQGGAACAGVPAPIAVLDPHAGVSGVAIATGQLGPTVGTSALVAEWSTGHVLQVQLQRDGPSGRGTVAPFLTGLTNPVPVLLSADGALLVGDWGTGTVYRIAASA
jgi:glucose/arabinose dehydrogenase